MALTTDQNPKATVLYLEDDEDIVEAIDTLLTIEGYQVVCAETGSKAITLLSDGEALPDLVISDNRLADSESGLDVVNRQQAKTGHNILAIMLTGYTEKSVHIHALKTVQKVLSKPGDADLLLKEIAIILSTH